jgi:preprotein translocase SecE subunit
VANTGPVNKRPRIRKSAPSVRERQEAAAAKAEAVKPQRVRRLSAKAASPFKKLNLEDKKAVQLGAKPFRFVRKVLGWLVPSYFINAWREVRKVVWPSRRETWRLTLAVFIFAIIFGAMVAGVDKGLDELFKKLVLK